MESLKEQPWHSEERLQSALLAFHQSSASYPKAAIAEAQVHHTRILDILRSELQAKKIADRVEYTGSSYEGIKVPSTKVEFDVMVVLARGKEVKVDKLKGRPLYARLFTSSTEEPLSKIADQGYLVPSEAGKYFEGKLQRIINNESILNNENIIKLKQHGPAVQMDVHHKNDKLFYSVDLVLTFCIVGEQAGEYQPEYYVAKPFKEEAIEDDPEERLLAWRRSYSLEEKKRLNDIDSGNKCRKQCIRILKVLRDKEANLLRMNSYIIKTAVLSLPDELDWSQKNLGRRFISILRYLAEAFYKGQLWHLYEEVNILDGWTSILLKNVASRLKELVRSEHEFYKALEKARMAVSVQSVSESASYYEDYPQSADRFKHGTGYESDSDSDQESAYSQMHVPYRRPALEHEPQEEPASWASKSLVGLGFGIAALGVGALVYSSYKEQEREEEERRNGKK